MVTFVIDKSANMDLDGRLPLIKVVIKDALLDSKEVQARTKEANIRVAIIGFDDDATVDLSSTTPYPGCYYLLVSQVEAIQPTNFKVQAVHLGLDAAKRQIESVQGAVAHTLILLTGKDDKIAREQFNALQKELKQTVKAQQGPS